MRKFIFYKIYNTFLSQLFTCKKNHFTLNCIRETMHNMSIRFCTQLRTNMHCHSISIFSFVQTRVLRFPTAKIISFLVNFIFKKKKRFQLEKKHRTQFKYDEKKSPLPSSHLFALLPCTICSINRSFDRAHPKRDHTQRVYKHKW